jgi:RNA polymerase sigma-70 factor (ECF subfamily)
MATSCTDHFGQLEPETSTKTACPQNPSVFNWGMSREEPIPTRASLLARLKDAGDHSSWNEFYQLYHDLIFATARRAGLNEHEAGEVVQDTLISVAKKMPGFTYNPAKDSFKGWLLTVTRWRIRDQLAKRPGQADRDPRLSSPKSGEEGTRTATIDRVPDPAGPDLRAIWDEEWETQLLHAALARIKRQVQPQHYQIYHLHVVLGQPIAEVGRTLGVSTARIYLAKHRVGNLVKKEVDRLKKAHL